MNVTNKTIVLVDTYDNGKGKPDSITIEFTVVPPKMFSIKG